jgi:hypothetical protein
VELGHVSVLGAHGGPGGGDQAVLSHGAPLRTRVERRLPALSSLRGQSPVQEIKRAAVGKRDISTAWPPCSSYRLMGSDSDTVTPARVKLLLREPLAERLHERRLSAVRFRSDFAVSVS